MSRRPTDTPARTGAAPRPPKAKASPLPPAAETAKPSGDRIAKVLSRAGVASRRDAERMIAEGRVSVNGKVLDSPALDVTPKDRITVDGAPLAPPEPPRVWLYHKPEGLVTTARDEQGRATVFDHLPEDLPRVMTVGRLDLNSEGLLLLTNDGGLKRRLELPSTGWLRKYRVRVNGRPEDSQFEPLRKGIVVDGENFQPMTVSLDRQQGANAWLTIGIREGRNREIRRAMEAVGLAVNRLIRVSYGPFQLGELKPGEVAEIRPRMLKDQLGLDETPMPRPEGTPRGAVKAGTRAGPAGKSASRTATGTGAGTGAPGKTGTTSAAAERRQPGAKGPGKPGAKGATAQGRSRTGDVASGPRTGGGPKPGARGGPTQSPRPPKGGPRR
ncbi:23S rRNA pseudouridine2605 synthase [Gemmobacter megaterium]|uniref:Pseudouridine synthase n=1 Tax=Gemmobacter megaterium TaxID=1086013 RepID=A0A1N7NQV3_9RHOB|nr:pseudouridine synthase [Gemmobacter megaterium]GGE17107.1 hypothetical protein GCM10011345_23760 [Gemmobacter megaterium]SIT00783.1 23S rRNA pseudouridine2605 synthase [Gemmobacter megaterium]